MVDLRKNYCNGIGRGVAREVTGAMRDKGGLVLYGKLANCHGFCRF